MRHRPRVSPLRLRAPPASFERRFQAHVNSEHGRLLKRVSFEPDAREERPVGHANRAAEGLLITALDIIQGHQIDAVTVRTGLPGRSFNTRVEPLSVRRLAQIESGSAD